VTPVATGSAVAGILILIVAIFALVQTWRLRIAADKSIARERRTAFELEVLRDLLGPVVSAGENAASSPAVRHYWPRYRWMICHSSGSAKKLRTTTRSTTRFPVVPSGKHSSTKCSGSDRATTSASTTTRTVSYC